MKYPAWYKQCMSIFEWQIEYQPVENLLLLKSKGVMDVPSANAMVKDLAEAAEKYQCMNHLIDHRETIFEFKITDYFERPAVNEKLGITRLFRTAMVFSKLTEETKFMENVFRNRGYNLNHFNDIERARNWLKQK
jgi:hypothetical protein